ncbi:hypothetical protein CAPTEDRAFT_194198 [Capitella teleta]|uniref:Uncharacterized protein n=1 Tax=Capitella teleta TaxID=283909 RepID=R7T7M0_CAPTE|nr:hypothetical protein CAPTEDRAFT_194198 [Capitella teleta]|eukprot:ELT87415.1 hypothetical protein CAPTEDRAFT_194198 [Capitella teleta]
MRNRGVTSDSVLHMEQHANNVAKAGRFHFRNISRIRLFISRGAFCSLVQAAVTSRSNYILFVFLLIIFVGRTGAQNEQPCCAVASSIISQFSRQQLEALDRVIQTTEARYSQITQSVQVVADKQQRDELKLSQVQSQLEQQMQELRVELQRQVDLIATDNIIDKMLAHYLYQY